MNFSKRKSFKEYRRYKFPKESCLNNSIYTKIGQKCHTKTLNFLLIFFWRFECKNNIIID